MIKINEMRSRDENFQTYSSKTKFSIWFSSMEIYSSFYFSSSLAAFPLLNLLSLNLLRKSVCFDFVLGTATMLSNKFDWLSL